jgi:hypothetical protein
MDAGLEKRCVACTLPIYAQALVNPWGQRLHPFCTQPPHCDACSAWLSAGQGQTIPDGRLLCKLCTVEGVSDPTTAAELLEQTITELGALGIAFTKDFPIQVCDRSEVQGLGGNRRSLGQTLTRLGDKGRRRVVRIVIVSRLRPPLFRGVAAHELTHAYLHQRGPVRLPRAATEGLCNYAASRIYRAEPHPMTKGLLKQLESDQDPHYGEGYRRVRDAIQGDDERLRRLLGSLEAGQIPSSISPSVSEWASGHLKVFLRRARRRRP